MSKKKKNRHFIVKVLSWGAISAVFTLAISYITKGYWEPHENIKFIEFATIVLTIIEDA